MWTRRCAHFVPGANKTMLAEARATEADTLCGTALELAASTPTSRPPWSGDGGPP